MLHLWVVSAVAQLRTLRIEWVQCARLRTRTSVLSGLQCLQGTVLSVACLLWVLHTAVMCAGALVLRIFQHRAHHLQRTCQKCPVHGYCSPSMFCLPCKWPACVCSSVCFCCASCSMVAAAVEPSLLLTTPSLFVLLASYEHNWHLLEGCRQCSDYKTWVLPGTVHIN